MHKLYGFFRRDVLLLLSYRFRLALDLVKSLGIVVFLFFIGKTFAGGFSVYLDRYGNDYFAFALVGIAVSAFASNGLNALSGEVSSAQVQGTLESLLMTPTRPGTILLGSTLWSFVESFFLCLLYLGVAAVLLNLDLSLGRVALVLGVLTLTLGCFLALGMLSAAFTMVFKQGNPITLLFGTSSFFLGGLVFPVEVLPGPLVTVSYLLPMTQAARAVREVFLVAPTSADWGPGALYLAVFAAVSLPLGVWALKSALARAKKDGSLVQF